MGTPLPPIAELTGGAVTENNFKTAVTEVRASLVERGDPFGRYGNRQNVDIVPTVAANALTIAAKQRDGNDATAEYPLVVAFRNPSIANFGFTERAVTGALSTVISSGSTAGHSSGVAAWLYIYAIEVGTSWELAWSSKFFGDQVIVTTTAEGGAGAADSATTMYSTTARSNVVAALLGRWKSTQTTAGLWASTGGEKALYPFAEVLARSGSPVDGFDPGTRLVFQQTVAPTGWTKSTTHNDKALRVVSGTVGSGGTTAFTSVFGAGKNAGGTVLTTSHLPASGLTLPDDVPSCGPGNSVSSFRPAGIGGTEAPGSAFAWGGAGSAGSVTGNMGSGNSHNHTLSLDLQYMDVIVAQKD